MKHQVLDELINVNFLHHLNLILQQEQLHQKFVLMFVCKNKFFILFKFLKKNQQNHLNKSDKLFDINTTKRRCVPTLRRD
jgi:hypothetical protein